MKEVIFKFNDGSEYHVREDKVGDSIMGLYAHDVMYAMNKHLVGERSLENKIAFIMKYNEINKIK